MSQESEQAQEAAHEWGVKFYEQSQQWSNKAIYVQASMDAVKDYKAALRAAYENLQDAEIKRIGSYPEVLDQVLSLLDTVKPKI